MEIFDFNLGDKRLNRRASCCMAKFSAHPGLSFPQIFDGSDELQGFYRLMNNERVEFKSLTESIVVKTRTNLAGAKVVIAPHDTTYVRPSKVGVIEEFAFSRGFFAHVSLLIDCESKKQIYGPGGLHIWTRKEKVKVQGNSGERERWFDQVEALERDFPEVELIHVMDREGDMCSVWSRMKDKNYRFVIRSRFDRLVKNNDGTAGRIRAMLDHAKVLGEREINISKRSKSPLPRTSYAPREQRKVTLKVASMEMDVHETSKHGKTIDTTEKLNFVRVFEDTSRADKVEWILLTSESVATLEQALEVVDIYRSRWIIEEFFKGVKTGCRLEERQLEDIDAWYKLTAMCLPIAADLLNLRLADNSVLTGEQLSQDQIQILKLTAGRKGKRVRTNKEALYEMARLGGHIASNGQPPGWITLMRGQKSLQEMEVGWILARQKM